MTRKGASILPATPGLAGLRVVEMGGSKTMALLGQLFADHGAEVIAICPPEAPHPQGSKTALPLAPHTPEGQALLQRLLLKTDFLLTEAELLPVTPSVLITVFLPPDATDNSGHRALLVFSEALVALQHRQRTGAGQQLDIGSPSLSAGTNQPPAS